jgi:hypothetical protein
MVGGEKLVEGEGDGDGFAVGGGHDEIFRVGVEEEHNQKSMKLGSASVLLRCNGSGSEILPEAIRGGTEEKGKASLLTSAATVGGLMHDFNPRETIGWQNRERRGAR